MNKIDVTNFLKDTNQVTLVFSYTGFDTIEKEYTKGETIPHVKVAMDRVKMGERV